MQRKRRAMLIEHTMKLLRAKMPELVRMCVDAAIEERMRDELRREAALLEMIEHGRRVSRG